jgi:hypothetical protein
MITVAYFTFFKDLAKQHWERNNWVGAFMPKDLRSYRQNFKVIVVIVLLGSIALYILFITGVFD